MLKSKLVAKDEEYKELKSRLDAKDESNSSFLLK